MNTEASSEPVCKKAKAKDGLWGALGRACRIPRVRLFLALGAVGVASYWALVPRPDWHHAPIHIWPLQFRSMFWSGGYSDKLAHAAFALVVSRMFDVATTCCFLCAKRRRVVLALSLGTWMGVIEGIQGLLPYRRCELADWLAGAFGVVLGLWAMPLSVTRARPSRMTRDPHCPRCGSSAGKVAS